MWIFLQKHGLTSTEDMDQELLVGLTGIGHHDLRKMPEIFQNELVDILNQFEQCTYWPEVWRTGFVHSLEKKEGATKVNEYRPVIIYSMIYRSWGSLRAQKFLHFLSKLG